MNPFPVSQTVSKFNENDSANGASTAPSKLPHGDYSTQSDINEILLKSLSPNVNNGSTSTATVGTAQKILRRRHSLPLDRNMNKKSRRTDARIASVDKIDEFRSARKFHDKQMVSHQKKLDQKPCDYKLPHDIAKLLLYRHQETCVKDIHRSCVIKEQGCIFIYPQQLGRTLLVSNITYVTVRCKMNSR